ncbi:hypothetical protein FTO70_08790 [Methanosarcina sp. KYL-1]|uniref:hypothetical protein n=1 Tax=Methanosarcina sp. KYL-1 TaxID=2602068 RepID=UPI002100B992|nr:hypothetical protein [Methanosarcina sp. KYL-1]MCQ1535770.1 hypothetical protein [Methanosarcina sp. KYL-1]
MPFTEETRLLDLGFSAVRGKDEMKLIRAVDELGKLGLELAVHYPERDPEKAISCIQTLGEAAAVCNMKAGLLDAAVFLGKIGQEAAAKGDDEAVFRAAVALTALGKEAADQKMHVPFRLVASSLKEVGKEAARQGMEKVAIASQAFLMELGTCCEKWDFEAFRADIPSLIRDVGKCAASARLEKAVISAELLLEKAQLALNGVILNSGRSSITERRICRETCTPLHCLGELGKVSCQRKLGLASVQASRSLEVVRKDAEAGYLGSTVLFAESLLDSFGDVKISSPELDWTVKEIRNMQAEVTFQEKGIIGKL